MPTVVCIDVSLSLQRKVDSESLLDLILSSLSGFIENLHSIVHHEYVEIITFSHVANVLVEFTRNTKQILDELPKVKCQDRTNINELIKTCHNECSEWSVLTPTHIIVLTDKIPNPITVSIGTFPFGCHMSLVALSPSIDVHNRTQAFFTSCNLKGKLYPGPVLGAEGLDRLLENILLDNYSKFEGTIQFGHHSTGVTITPAPSVTLLAGITGHPTPKTFPSTLKIHGFLPLSELHNPPYVCKHMLYPTGGKSPVKSSAKIPDMRVILNESLRVKNHAAVIELGLGWFGVISCYLPKTEKNVKKSNLSLSIIAPNSFPWLGNLDFLGLKRLISTTKQANIPYREAFPNSYDNKTGSGMVWVKSSTLKQNIMKVVRYAKRLPDKSSTVFLKELNKVRRSIMYYGFTDMMGVLCEMLRKEITPENSGILEKCIAQLLEERDPLKAVK